MPDRDILIDKAIYMKSPFNPEIPTLQGIWEGLDPFLGLRGIKFPDTIT